MLKYKNQNVKTLTNDSLVMKLKVNKLKCRHANFQACSSNLEELQSVQEYELSKISVKPTVRPQPRIQQYADETATELASQSILILILILLTVIKLYFLRLCHKGRSSEALYNFWFIGLHERCSE